MNKRIVRDFLRLFGVFIFFWLYLPHLVVFMIQGGGKQTIDNQ